MNQEIIRLENIKKTFKLKKENIIALSNINLSIKENDIYGIIGLSGAGKSTLIRCINYLEKPTDGKVYYKGIDLSTLKNKDLLKVRQNIGMIFQGFNLLEQRTVLQNVLFPLEITKMEKEKAQKKAIDLLKMVGLEDKLNAYPSQLSGGQKQRVAIARALANDPSVLLCDEATSALDPNTTTQILKLLKKINTELGITIVLITHEMRVVETICNKVAIIEDGLIKEEGEVKEIFMNPKTDIAKSLILHQIDNLEKNMSNTKLRIIFEGNVLEPVISEMILKTKVLINILQANIKTVEDKIYGEMIIQLPTEETALLKIKNYLNTIGLSYQEV